MGNIQGDEKSILIDQIVSIMYENSAFGELNISNNEFFESTLKDYLENKTLEELREEYNICQMVFSHSKKR